MTRAIKQAIFTFTLTLCGVVSFAQTSQGEKFKKDTLYTTGGFKIYIGQVLNIGTGSTPDGDFKFIRKNSTGLSAMGTALSSDDNRYINSQLALPRSMSGHTGEVIKILKRGNKRVGIVYEPIISIGGSYEIDVENAINSGELLIPDEFKPKVKTPTLQVVQPVSIADELIKLKKLKDDGELSQAEYEKLRKKLLDKE